MKIKKLDHLSKIFQEYDAFIIDLWGVMHNGIKLNSSAMNTVRELESNGKRVVFLSNAPRPTKNVVEFLKKMKMEDRYLKNVLTSGEAAMNSLKNNEFGEKFYHLGPQRDDSLFFDLKKIKLHLRNVTLFSALVFLMKKMHSINRHGIKMLTMTLLERYPIQSKRAKNPLDMFWIPMTVMIQIILYTQMLLNYVMVLSTTVEVNYQPMKSIKMAMVLSVVM